MKTIAITNQKGGVGKSTTALAMGAGLQMLKQRVLFIDLDPQANLTYTLGANSEKPGALQVLSGQISATDAIQKTPFGDCISGDPQLAAADIDFHATGKEYRLKEALETLDTHYDFVMIDTPPALGILTVNALCAADELIIPAQADIYSLQGISQLANTLRAVQKYCNPSLFIRGILLTRYNTRSILSRDVYEMIDETANKLGTKVFVTTIRECISLKEAQISRKDIFHYAPKSNAAIDYARLVDEYLNDGGQDIEKELQG